jgi:hypothetical protein
VPGTDTSAPADLRPKELGIAKPHAAGLAVDRERRAERGVARRAAAQHGAAALGALFRHLCLELVEPAPRGAAAKAEGNPVSEDLTTLLAQPLRGFPHALTLVTRVRADLTADSGSAHDQRANKGRELEILLASFALFVFVVRAVRNHKWDEAAQRTTQLVRTVTALVAASIAAGAGFWLHHLAKSPDAYIPAYVLTAGIGLGAMIYLAGTLLGDGTPALALRWIGWIVMTASLLVPSTFSLFLPVFAALAVSLRPLAQRRADGPVPTLDSPGSS